MGMAIEDKEKCAAIYEAHTGEYTDPMLVSVHK